MEQPVTVRWVNANWNPSFVGPLSQSVLTDAQKRRCLRNFEVFVQLLHQTAPDKSRSRMNNPKLYQSLHGRKSTNADIFSGRGQCSLPGHRPRSSQNVAKSNDFGHFGNTESTWLDNLLYLYTEPFDVVIDPFAGGGPVRQIRHACRI